MDEFTKIFQNFDKCSLTCFERNLILELCPVIKPAIENFINTSRVCGSQPLYDTSRSVTRTILDYEEKINRIVRVLDSSDHRRETFLGNFPTWKRQREENIKKLREIATSMKEVRQVSNIVKITSGSVGIGGGAAIIGSLIFPPAAPALLPAWLGGAAASALLPSVFLGAAPAVSSLAVAGGVAAAGGLVGNAGASITELVLTSKSMDEAKEVIEKDRTSLEKLKVYEFFEDLNKAIDNLFGKSTSNEILNYLPDFLKNVPPIFDNIGPIKRALNLFLSRILPGLSQFLLVGISLASVILSIFLVVFLIRRRGCAILTHRFALGLVSAVDAGVEVTRLIAAASLKEGSKLAELIPRQLAGKIAVGAVAGVGIALDIATIVISSIDLAEGSLSDEASMILEVAKKLETHLNSYKGVNDELRKCVARRLRRNEVTDWTSVIVNHIPLDGGENDIRTAIKQYLPDEAWDCIILERLPTNGNHWLVEVPTSHSQMFLGQTYVDVRRERCLVMT